MRLLSLCALAALACSLGCGNNGVVAPPDTKAEARPDTKKKGDTPAETKETKKNDTPAAKAEPWGTVKGRVTFGGAALPAPPALVVPPGTCPDAKNVPDEKWVVNKDNKGVANVFVWLVDGADPKHRKAPPIHPSLKVSRDKEVVIDQPCCKFEPHAVALRDDQALVVKNSGTVLHNFNWVGNGLGDNFAIPTGGKVAAKGPVAANKPYSVNCNVHGWMKAYFFVFDHPYFAVTDPDGEFEIRKAPAGKFNLVMWHEEVGWVNGERGSGQAVEIKPGGVTEVNREAKPE